MRGFFFIQFPPYPAEKREQVSSLVGIWQPVKVNPPHMHKVVLHKPRLHASFTCLTLLAYSSDMIFHILFLSVIKHRNLP